jgi:hypothetical protein
MIIDLIITATKVFCKHRVTELINATNFFSMAFFVVGKLVRRIEKLINGLTIAER